jgi:hypothetical protein
MKTAENKQLFTGSLFLAVFIFIGRCLALNNLGMTPYWLDLLAQGYLFFIFICVISYKGYCFGGSGIDSIWGKIVMFFFLLAPEAALFWIERPGIQFVLLSFGMVSGVIFCFVRLVDLASNKSRLPIQKGFLFLWICLLFVLAVLLLKYLEKSIFHSQVLQFLPNGYLRFLLQILGSGVILNILFYTLKTAIEKDVIIKPFRKLEPTIPVVIGGRFLISGIINTLLRVTTTLFINLLFRRFFFNLFLNTILRKIIDFFIRVLYGMWNVIAPLVLLIIFILPFLLIYFVTFATLFTIHSNSQELIAYLHGDDSRFITVLSMTGALIFLSIFFKFLVILTFTEMIDDDEFWEGLLENIKTTLISNLEIGLVIAFCSLIAGVFFIHPFLFRLQPIGKFSKLIGLVFLISLAILLITFVAKPRQPKTAQAEDEEIFDFTSLEWQKAFATPVLWISFTIIISMACFWDADAKFVSSDQLWQRKIGEAVQTIKKFEGMTQFSQ